MKNLSKVTILVLAVVLMSACVSKKKYDEALAAAAAEKSALESALAEANAEKSKLQADAQKLQDDLNMSKEEIMKLAETVKANNEKIAKLENAIRDVFDDYDENQVSVSERNGKLYITLSNSILFESGRARIAKEAQDVIGKLASVLNASGGLSISIEGHTDNEPVQIHKAKYTDNWGLSTARALNILRELEKNGVDGSRLTASGKGDTEPIASNDTPEGREQNRRTEFVINPDIDGLYKMYKEELSASSGNTGGSK
ncbi:MAG: hypothetical protein D6730_21645 [Bacteroidetes bacterium]|nr:MAG: hypothetical protein D6730_21645 [Bacteroidota bacterium]